MCGKAKRVAGFTLIEMMVTVLIIAVLASIAFAAYQSYIIKTRRSAAATCLQERAQFMERFYTTKLTYAAAPAPAQCEADVATFYAVSFNGTPDASTYVLQAVPLGQQLARDTLCQTLTINQQGTRGDTGSASATPESCW